MTSTATVEPAPSHAADAGAPPLFACGAVVDAEVTLEAETSTVVMGEVVTSESELQEHRDEIARLTRLVEQSVRIAGTRRLSTGSTNPRDGPSPMNGNDPSSCVRSFQLQAASRWSNFTPRGGAAIPVVASALLSSVSRAILLPRAEEVQTVIDSLLDRGGGASSIGDSAAESEGGSIPRQINGSHVAGSSGGGDRAPAFDATDFSTVIRGMGGMGKTTLAAITVSRNEVLSRFRDGVGWVKLSQRGLIPPDGPRSGSPSPASPRAYEEYVDHLRALCRQIGIPVPVFDEPVFQGGDSESARGAKVLRAMQDARQDMSNLLAGRSVLLVVDDLWHLSDLDWFSFANRPSSSFRLLITTRLQFKRAGSSGREAIVDLTALKEGEAVNLFLTEAKPSSLAARECDEKDRANALIVVKACQLHPVTVRSAGRLLSTSSCEADATRGRPLSLSSLAADLSSNSCGGEDGCVPTLDGHNLALYEILDRSLSSDLLGDVVSTAAKVCFVAFAVAFCRDNCSRPWVPVTAIHMLWDGILTQDERSTILDVYGSSATSWLLKRMENLGLIDLTVNRCRELSTGEDGAAVPTSVEVRNYRVYHDSMLQFARFAWEHHAALEAEKMRRRLLENKVLLLSGPSMRVNLSSLKGLRIRSDPREQRKMKENPSLQLDLVLVRKYEEKRKCKPDQPWDLAVPDDGYVFEYLPYHMMKIGGEVMWRKTLLLLRDKGFIRARITSMGVESGTKAHASDIEALVRQMASEGGKGMTKKGISINKKSKKKESPLSEALLTFNVLSSFLDEQILEGESFVQSSRMAMRKREEAGIAFVTIGITLQNLVLMFHALDMFAKALETFKAAGLCDDNPVVERTNLHVQASALPKVLLVSRESSTCIKFKYASKLQEQAKKDTGAPPVPKAMCGISLELSSHPGLAVVLMRPHFLTMFGICCITLGIGPKESALHMFARQKAIGRPGDGAYLSCTPEPQENDPLFLTPRVPTKCFDGECYKDFVVNDDETISPAGNSRVALGIGGYPVVLVARNSPSRFIFKHAKDFGENNIGGLKRDISITEGLSLELVSHPGYAVICQLPAAYNYGPFHMNMLLMGPAENTMQAHFDGRIIRDTKDGAVFRVNTETDTPYFVGSPVFLMQVKKQSKSFLKGGVNHFVVNGDGSISPLQAPNFALGCAVVGKVNEIITREARLQAESKAKLKPAKMSSSEKSENSELVAKAVSQFDVAKLKT